MAYQWINGQRQAGTGGLHSVINPANEEVIAEVDLATEVDLDLAIHSAQRAQVNWAKTTPAARSELLLAWAGLVAGAQAELIDLEVAQTGKTLRMATEFDLPGTIDNISFFAGAARHLTGLASGEYSADHTSSIRREPIGIIGSIAPWNYPLQMAAWKILPAIAAGNSIILKPSELTPLTTLRIAELAAEAGIPAGVIQVLTGTGVDLGAKLIAHPAIGMVSFTGSTTVGKQVGATAAGLAKRVHLELGGKAPLVVFDDADLTAAIHGAVAASMINTGQDCTAATRAIVHQDLYADFCAGVAQLFSKLIVGDPLAADTDLGPLISKTQQSRVADHVNKAVSQGSSLICGGHPLDRVGAFFEPTLIAAKESSDYIMQTEVFGPVLAAIAFNSDDEAFTYANDTVYGLAASAWTTNTYRAQRATREIQAGCVWINDHIPIISEMPHGGFKQSGFGKDMSSYSLDDYSNIKHVMLDNTEVAKKPWHRTVFNLPN